MLFEKFKLNDILEKVDIKNIKGMAGDFPKEYSEEYCIPLLSSATTNQGFSRYAKREDCPKIIKNVISVSANGTAIAFYQPYEFAILQDAYALKLKNRELTEEIGLYLITLINRLLISENFNWKKKSCWNKIKEFHILLPIDSEKRINWDYMTDYINFIKRKEVENFKTETLKKIQAFIQAAKINKIEFSDEDEEILMSFK